MSIYSVLWWNCLSFGHCRWFVTKNYWSFTFFSSLFFLSWVKVELNNVRNQIIEVPLWFGPFCNHLSLVKIFVQEILRPTEWLASDDIMTTGKSMSVLKRFGINWRANAGKPKRKYPTEYPTKGNVEPESHQEALVRSSIVNVIRFLGFLLLSSLHTAFFVAGAALQLTIYVF